MSRTKFRRKTEELMALADLRIGGDRPWDLQVHDERFYGRVLAQASLGLGEAYMDGWWDCEQLDELICKIMRSKLNTKVRMWVQIYPVLKARLLNLQSRSRAFEIGERHYDTGNDLYERMLDRRMIYSCGYWKDASTLDDAQEAKLDLVCRKLGLEKGMRVLDIGCGWGGTLQFAAERYGVEGVGVTVSKEQAKYARQLCADLPVEIRLQDYRSLDEKFDRVLSIGMFEHVGLKNYPAFMQVVRRCLGHEGLFLLHTIGRQLSSVKQDPFMERYIFPNSMLPSARQISAAAEGLFVLEDWHSFGQDYDRTLMQWSTNFDRHWDEIKDQYDGRFYRMWKFYLLSGAGAFRARFNNLWQIVFSTEGVTGGYQAPR